MAIGSKLTGTPEVGAETLRRFETGLRGFSQSVLIWW